MIFLVPWRLLEWARDNRVLRIRWFGLEAEFAQPFKDPQSVWPQAQTTSSTADTWQPPPELPPEEQARQGKERERAEAEKVLYHSA